ncbi:sucrase ferredoxin [Actinomadura scrupuli]|uniref:sucrase ferredoxin n=1 Tax=Actinomadura scrupuli TaxID=559629 RepID=UPI003D988990
MSKPAHSKRCEHCPGSHTGQLPCLATATTKARGWLLLEHPGPWGERIEKMDLPAPMASAVAEAGRAGVRPQLIRRAGRRRVTPPLQVYTGWSQGSDVWVEGRELHDPAELAGLDLAAVAAGVRPGFGEPVTGPLLLVCTHGRRNACCARTGAPLARELHARFGDLVWETTHLGGDRYAANLACLPHGLYYGNLGGAEAIHAVESYLRGEVALERLRGRAGLPEPAQALEHHVRERTGLLGVDAVGVESVTGGARGVTVVVKAGGDRYQASVELSEADGGCGAECNENVRSYRIRDMTLLNEAALV